MRSSRDREYGTGQRLVGRGGTGPTPRFLGSPSGSDAIVVTTVVADCDRLGRLGRFPCCCPDGRVGEWYLCTACASVPVGVSMAATMTHLRVPFV
jgi:hypothetical protein